MLKKYSIALLVVAFYNVLIFPSKFTDITTEITVGENLKTELGEVFFKLHTLKITQKKHLHKLKAFLKQTDHITTYPITEATFYTFLEQKNKKTWADSIAHDQTYELLIFSAPTNTAMEPIMAPCIYHMKKIIQQLGDEKHQDLLPEKLYLEQL